jgi:hypothetical protein
MYSKLRQYALVFLPLLWIPILLSNPYFFLRGKRGNIENLYDFYCNNSSEVFMGIIILGILYSCYRVYKIPGKIKYLFAVFVVISVPIQYLLFIAAEIQVFGK